MIGGWCAGLGVGEAGRLGMTGSQNKLQPVEGRRVTGRDLEDRVLQATERAQFCEVPTPRGAQHLGLVGGQKGGAAHGGITPII